MSVVKEGDYVFVHKDAKEIMSSHAVQWNHKMDKTQGQQGQVVKVDYSDCTVEVQLPTVKWWYTFPAVVKVERPYDFRVGDRVSVSADAKRIMEAHPVNWAKSMDGVLGKSGQVVQVDDADCTAEIDFGSKKWWFAYSCIGPDTGEAADDLPEDSSKWDVFLSHDWGTDASGRSNHDRVRLVNEGLKRRGYRTWFDDEKMEGDIMSKMCEGIDGSKGVIAFVTGNYIKKVGSASDHDNCKKEFTYSARTKGASSMFSVVMEREIKDDTKWLGPVGMTLGGKLYSRCFDEIESAVDELVRQLMKANIHPRA